MAANTFGIHQSTVSKVILEVCIVVTKNLCTKYLQDLHFPKTEEEMKQKVPQFEVEFCMSQAFDAIDGAHIQYKAAQEIHKTFLITFFFISVKTVCDYRGIFMDIDRLWPRSLHHAKMFANSNVNQRMVKSVLQITYQYLLPEWTKVPSFFVVFFDWRSSLSINTIFTDTIYALYSQRGSFVLYMTFVKCQKYKQMKCKFKLIQKKLTMMIKSFNITKTILLHVTQMKSDLSEMLLQIAWRHAYKII